MIFLRRRPLARAAVVGGLGYAAGRSAANNAQRENDQQARIDELEAQQAAQAAAGNKGGTAAPAPVTTDVTAKLQQLANLKAQGLLTDTEYEAAKQKLLMGL